MWTDLDTRAISISVGIDVDVGMYFKNDDADEGFPNALGLNRLVGRIDGLEGVTHMRVLTGLADLKMSMFVQATMGLRNLLS